MKLLYRSIYSLQMKSSGSASEPARVKNALHFSPQANDALLPLSETAQRVPEQAGKNFRRTVLYICYSGPAFRALKA
jgi:hypothetical protein